MLSSLFESSKQSSLFISIQVPLGAQCNLRKIKKITPGSNNRSTQSALYAAPARAAPYHTCPYLGSRVSEGSCWIGGSISFAYVSAILSWACEKWFADRSWVPGHSIDSWFLRAQCGRRSRSRSRRTNTIPMSEAPLRMRNESVI